MPFWVWIGIVNVTLFFTYLLLPQLLDYDRFSHDEVVGEIRFLLNTLDLSGCELWGDLIAVRRPKEAAAELLISLSYLPQAERLTVVVMKAKNLSISHEPFVKVSVW